MLVGVVVILHPLCVAGHVPGGAWRGGRQPGVRVAADARTAATGKHRLHLQHAFGVRISATAAHRLIDRMPWHAVNEIPP